MSEKPRRKNVNIIPRPSAKPVYYHKQLRSLYLRCEIRLLHYLLILRKKTVCRGGKQRCYIFMNIEIAECIKNNVKLSFRGNTSPPGDTENKRGYQWWLSFDPAGMVGKNIPVSDLMEKRACMGSTDHTLISPGGNWFPDKWERWSWWSAYWEEGEIYHYVECSLSE